jgi:hypothetical protein
LVVVVVGQERYNNICPPVKENTLDISSIKPSYINSFNCGGVAVWLGLCRKVCVFLFYGVVVLQGLRTPAVSEIQCIQYTVLLFLLLRGGRHSA